MAIFVESNPFAVLGYCGVAPKQLPVKSAIVTEGYTEKSVMTYEKDGSGRVVKITKSPEEVDTYSHIQVYEIEY